MKKMILIISILIVSVSPCLSQETDSIRKPMTKQDFLQKSRNQRTTAFVLLGVGVAFDIAGIATTISNANKEIDNVLGEGKSVNHSTEYVLYICGTAALFTSLPLFIASRNNKKKALSMAINTLQLPQLKNGNKYTVNYPALTLTMRF